VLAIAALGLLGVDVRGWFSDVWDALTGVGLGYLVAGWGFQTAQTTLTALGWYLILRAGFADAGHRGGLVGVRCRGRSAMWSCAVVEQLQGRFDAVGEELIGEVAVG
jgi:hypothetical protein